MLLLVFQGNDRTSFSCTKARFSSLSFTAVGITFFRGDLERIDSKLPDTVGFPDS